MATLNGTTGADILNGDTDIDGAGPDIINGKNGDDTILAGAGDDRANGDGGNDDILGGAGADRLDGGSGDDVLDAGYDDGAVDTLIGGIGNDWFDGVRSGDIVDGGSGFDTFFIFNFGDPADWNLGGTTGDAVRTVTIGADLTDITVSGIEMVNATGGGGADIIRVGDALAAVAGGGGDDTLLGGGNNDFLRPGAGNDVVNGGAGLDRVGYYGAPGGVSVSLLLQGQGQDTGMGLDVLTNIEHVSGTPHDDILIGDKKANWLWGQGGNNLLDGGAGNDLLSVDASNSTLNGGGGKDTIDVFGNGLGYTSGVFLSLDKQGVGQNTGQGVMLLTGIENASGTIHDDVLTGDKGVNILCGVFGADTLSGGDGNDQLFGDGHYSVDTSPSGGSGPITLFTQVGDPTAVGDDFLFGGNGRDKLTGGWGSDLLAGGKGIDTFVFLSVEDSVRGKADYILDLSNAQDIIDISAIDADDSTDGDDAFVLVASGTGVAGQAWLTYDAAQDITTLELDVDGGGADFELEIAGDHSGFSNFVL